MIDVRQDEDGDWVITSTEPLTDAEALGLTFRAEPRQVRLGAYVEVRDPEGSRIGHLASATYVEPNLGPAYVICAITLR